MTAATPPPSELPAGRELDEQIDQVVFDRIWLHNDQGGVFSCARSDAGGAKLSGYKIGRGPLSSPEYFVTPYSTDIAAAWTIVEHLVGRDWNVIVRSRTNGGYWCSFVRRGQERVNALAEADTAPLAIALASLEAVALERQGEESNG